MPKPSKRICLACKGRKIRFDYNTHKYTMTSCTCCDQDGQVPFYSNDDGYGPLDFKQHVVTTEVVRGKNILGSTTDVKTPSPRTNEIVVKLNGVFTVNELMGMCSLLEKLKAAGNVRINCECCKKY